ncbi:MAG: Uma2 family endonuclease [Bacteroidota bacterium]
MDDVTTKAPPRPLPTYDAPMTWADVLTHPALQDLPFKIELNERGQILMSPASNWHGALQIEIAATLRAMLGNRVLGECSIDTTEGVRVADVAWASPEFIAEHGYATPYTTAPELCVEVKSPSNTEAEMQEKVALYLAKGAQEVWLCDLNGRVRFFGPKGQRERSEIAPDFPSQLES